MSYSEQTCIIDTRESEAYCDGHPAGAFHFPWTKMHLLSGGLPDRDENVVVVVSKDDPKEAEKQQFFERLNYSSVQLRQVHEYAILTQEVPNAFCFKPNSFLSNHIEKVERNVGGPHVALDVGCGSGRDMIYVAKRGWLVCGIENRQRLLLCADALAEKFGVKHRISCLLWDVRRGKLLFRRHSYQLLHICRFIYRPSLVYFIEGLSLGGYVVYSHFLEGCEKTTVGHPKNDSGFFLRGELEALLESYGVRILHASENILFDGRPMIHVLGKKISDKVSVSAGSF